VLIRCPSCAFAFELAAESVGVKATTACPSCARVVVLRDANVVPPGGDATVPLQVWTEMTLPPLTPEEQATRRSGLSLPRGKRVSVAVMAGPGSGNVYHLDRPRVVIGRAGAGAALQLDDPEVSREHAALECREERVFLRDLGSRNGTFVDEKEVKEHALKDGSEFRLGRTRLLLMIADQR
jgi:pSer/pThr/pTyr-binding forkhead associated (FHA) protein